MDARVKALLPPSTHIWSERSVDLWFVMTCAKQWRASCDHDRYGLYIQFP